MRWQGPTIAVVATMTVGLVSLVEPGSAATAQVEVAERTLGLERRVLDLERRVVPFDGRAEAVVGTEVTVALDTDVLFEFDQATLTPQAQQTLADLAAELEDRLAGDTVAVVGHTDSRGTADYNQDLSVRRAEAVRDFLAPGLDDAVIFDVQGRGATEPVASNEAPDGSDDPDGRRRNRRVEITYTSTGQEAPS